MQGWFLGNQTGTPYLDTKPTLHTRRICFSLLNKDKSMPKVIRINECGHPERKYLAKGMCSTCYMKAYNADPKRKTYNAKPEVKAQARAYRAKPEVMAQRKAYETSPEGIARRKAYRTSPKKKAKVFCRQYPICKYEDVLKYQLILLPDRICWLCLKPGPTNLDHDHGSGKIRGWAHSSCNRAEGNIKNSPDPIALLTTLIKQYTHPQAD